MLHVETGVTMRNIEDVPKSVIIDGIAYISTSAVLEALSISRQTLWRWRNEGKVPPGRRYRGRHVVFSQPDFEAISAYANLLEPITKPNNKDQLKLFNGGKKG
jgi:predicted DNA-binding transcriptional regulator AlpA